MKEKIPNAAVVWKQIEDDVIPQMRLSMIDRAVYSHLLRHSWLEGKPRIRFTIAWLSHGAGLSVGAARTSLHRLIDHRALRLVECSKDGHVVQVRLPEEIHGVRLTKIKGLPQMARVVNLEKTNFLRNQTLRRAIYRRDDGKCFYCLRRLRRRRRCLDHVVPRAKLGANSYRNLVSCCDDCNMKKKDRPARELLRWLYREGRLSAHEMKRQMRALDHLAAGKLRPELGLSTPGAR